MRSLKSFPQIYLCRNFVDFRKSINGLSTIVHEELNLIPTNEGLFVFCNKSRNRLKILYWDKSGFALWYKRLEEQKFKWPSMYSEKVIFLKPKEIEELLKGLDVFKKHPHKELKYENFD